MAEIEFWTNMPKCTSFGLGSDPGGEADFSFPASKIGTVLKFCTVIETHTSDHFKKKVAKSIAN